MIPLLIIVFTYNMLSLEKEQGTWVLLKTSNQSIARLVLYWHPVRSVRLGYRVARTSGSDRPESAVPDPQPDFDA